MPDLNPQPLPPHSDERVRVFVPHEVAFDIDKMSKITADILGQRGCPTCHSGFSIDFVTLRDFVVNPRTLEVQPVIGTQILHGPA